MLEPYEGKLSRTVLRGERDSNIPDLLDRPDQLTQRNGRILRQGNENKEIEIFNYITEGSFDSYLYQILENKQKFISQVMTEKSPLRTCDDIDEVVLNYAEIKGLAMNNPFIKEKMQVDTEINKLTLLKSSWQESKEKLKNIIKDTPTKIERLSNSLEKVKQDIETYRVNKPIDFKITLNEKSFLDRTKAGEYLNTLIKNIAKEKPTDDIEEIGSFSGFKVGFTYTMGVSKIYLIGEKTYSKDLGVSDIGNITRLENLADDIVKELELYEERLKESEQKLIQSKEEVNKPFEQEERLRYLYKRKIEIDYNVENGIITEVKEDDNVIEETTNFYDFKDMSVSEIKETFKTGMLIKLENMQGENLPSGLLGAVERVDDIGQVKIIWQNGSTLSLNVKEDSFEIISNENTKENEYTQNEEIYEEKTNSKTLGEKIAEKIDIVKNLNKDKINTLSSNNKL